VAEKDQHEVKTSKGAVLWNPETFGSAAKLVSAVRGKNKEETRKKKERLIRNMSLEEALTLAFPITGLSLERKTFDGLWEKLTKVQKDPCALFADTILRQTKA
jgi:hypothetical protein